MAITIDLKETSYAPGDIVSGTVTWELENKHPKQIVVKLIWVTEGKGDVDTKEVKQEIVNNPATSGSYEFHLKLPLFPWSYEGKLFALKWNVVIDIDSHNLSSTPIVCGPNKEPIKS